MQQTRSQMCRLDVHRSSNGRESQWTCQTFQRQRTKLLSHCRGVYHGWLFSKQVQKRHQALLRWLFWLKICYRSCHRYIVRIESLVYDLKSIFQGDSSNQIHFEAYQVSNQCTALVKDDCIIPTLDAPELAYIRESSNDKYIPDVYFREKDQYNNEVTKIARPLPVEYLIVDLPAGLAKDAYYSFNDDNPQLKFCFPIENRANIGESQDFSSLQKYMNQFPSYRFIEAMSNFHLLIFLITNQTVHFDVSPPSFLSVQVI